MNELPDITALLRLPLHRHTAAIGLHAIDPLGTRLVLDREGLWWVAPFARGASGTHYGWRMSLGEGHGAVVRTASGHAVTIASRPSDAILAAIALEVLLIGPKARARLSAGWTEAAPVLRDAIAVCGGDGARLEAIVHLADDLPRWRARVSRDEETQRRRALATILGDESMPVTGSEPVFDPAWQRSRDSLCAERDIDTATRLLEGNHGLDGAPTWAGLSPDTDAAASALTGFARRAIAEGRAPAQPWSHITNVLGRGAMPEPRDFVDSIVSRTPAEAWEAFAAASFWWKRAYRTVPEEIASAAEELAEHVGASHILAARGRRHPLGS